MYIAVVNHRYTRYTIERWMKTGLQEIEKLMPNVYLFKELPLKRLIFTQNFNNLRFFKEEEMSASDYFEASR